MWLEPPVLALPGLFLRLSITNQYNCLAGDLFGVYSFNEPLEVGSRVVFRNAGAYFIVKANMFNGINLPNIYSLTAEGELVLVKRFTYEDFASRCGDDTRAAYDQNHPFRYFEMPVIIQLRVFYRTPLVSFRYACSLD